MVTILSSTYKGRLESLFARWYGPRLVFDCPSESEIPLRAPEKKAVNCPNPDSEAELFFATSKQSAYGDASALKFQGFQ
jgi:hypothetical protein